MSNQIDLNRYQEFVKAVTSHESNYPGQFINQIQHICSSTDINPSLLLTAAIGLAAETGEFAEIPKKILFQGKPVNEENIFHMKRELGDIAFYWVNACRALNLDPNDVIAENVKKLEARYPNGFSVERSEKREAGDI